MRDQRTVREEGERVDHSPVSAQVAYIVDKHVLAVLFHEFRFAEHCLAIKRYLLLGQGDFIQMLLDLVVRAFPQVGCRFVCFVYGISISSSKLLFMSAQIGILTCKTHKARSAACVSPRYV